MAVEIVAQGGLTPLYIAEEFRRPIARSLTGRRPRLQPSSRSARIGNDQSAATRAEVTRSQRSTTGNSRNQSRGRAART
jgi:hypothetical protein